MKDDVQALRTELIGLLPRLRRFARGLAGSASEADDLVQDACEKALKNMHQFTPGTAMDSWMYRIVQNSWRDKLRSSHRRLTDPAPLEERFDLIGSKGDEAETRLTLDAVFQALDTLDANQRVVLLLVCIEGLSYAEAARTLDWPVGTVMSRLARGRLALHGVLEGPTNVVPLRRSGDESEG